MDKLEVAFGKVLKQIREKRGLTQEKLALSGGLDRTYISLLERGHRQPSLKTIFQLAKPLEIKPEEMISLVSQLIVRDA